MKDVTGNEGRHQYLVKERRKAARFRARVQSTAGATAKPAMNTNEAARECDDDWFDTYRREREREAGELEVGMTVFLVRAPLEFTLLVFVPLRIVRLSPKRAEVRRVDGAPIAPGVATLQFERTALSRTNPFA